MFRKAYAIASQFTFPLIVSSKYFDGRVECGIGAYILLNETGWILTAAHMMLNMLKAQEDLIKISEYNQKKIVLENNYAIDSKAKTKKIARLYKDNNWIINQSYWWAKDDYEIDNCILDQYKDIAIVHLSNYMELPGQIYPRFLSTSENNIGESVCKLGFPLHEVNATYDVSNNRFVLAPNTVPVPRFPLEGIIARFNYIIDESGKQIKHIETTSPGLRGQSGGPIFNTNGEVYAMQIRTNHYNLGFNPSIKINGKRITEYQFLNTGLGISSEEIISFCKDNNVKINSISM